MDPLSMTASITAIIQLTVPIISYLNDLKDCSNDQAKLAIEISNINGLLTALRFRVANAKSEDPWFTGVRKLAVENGPLSQFQSSLEQLTAKLSLGGGFKKFRKMLTWKFDKVEINDILSRIERLKTAVNFALSSDHFTLSQVIKDDLADMKADQVDRAQLALLDWLSPLDFKSRQRNVFAKRQKGTGEWLLKSLEFKELLCERQETLWCPGVPGAGKTVLASIVVDHLQTIFKDDNVAIACIYCKYKEKTEQTVVNLIASLLKQLLQDHATIYESAKGLYNEHVKGNTRPNRSEVVRELRSEIGSYSKVFIVVDALDECPEELGTRKDLLTELRSLPQPANLMITSRYLDTIQLELNRVRRLDIRAADEDVERYVRGRIPREDRLSKHMKVDPTLQDAVINTIVANAKGMLLLAQLHMDSLASKTNRKAIRDALKHLPEGLDDTYDEVMQRIDGQNKGDKELAKKVLSWICFALRPLSARELQHALAVEDEDIEIETELDEALTDVEILTSVCAGLVIIDEESSIVRLVHYTTQDYLERVRMAWFPYAQTSIATTCLTYISFNVFAEGPCPNDQEMEIRLHEYPFLEYAAQHWSEHARGDPEETVREIALGFLEHDSKLMCSNQVVHLLEHRYSEYSQCFPKGVTGLQIAASFGLVEVVRLLLERGADVAAKDDVGSTALHLAANRWHEAVVRLLLERGAEIAAKDSARSTALHQAANSGHEAVVRLLLEGGADVAVKDYIGSTVLHLAANSGYEAVVRLLLESGADVAVKDDIGSTVLHLATNSGHEAVVRLLLERGADVAAKGNIGLTALHLAAYEGHEAVVRLLLERGAGVAAKNDFGSTALHLAAYEGHEAVIRLLTSLTSDP